MSTRTSKIASALLLLGIVKLVADELVFLLKVGNTFLFSPSLRGFFP